MKNIIITLLSLIISGVCVFVLSIFVLDYRYDKNDSKVIEDVSAATTGTCYSANNKFNDLTPKEYIVPTLVDGIVVKSGGYYIVGNMVVFDMHIGVPSSITLSSDVNNGTKIMSNIPKPLGKSFSGLHVIMTATSVLVHPSAAIVKDGNLYMINSNNLYHYDYSIFINGSYLMA